MNWRLNFRFLQKCRRALRHASLLALALAGAGAVAGDAVPPPWPAEAIIHFSATSTLHDFGGTVPAQPFMLTLSSNAWSAEADVLAGLMETAHPSRDRKMRRMFNTNAYPFIRGKVSSAPIPNAAGTNVTLSLWIRDRKHDLSARVTDWSETATRIAFHAEWDVSLTQYGLKPPSVLGLIRVGDKVRLAADVVVNKTQVLSNAPASANAVTPLP